MTPKQYQRHLKALAHKAVALELEITLLYWDTHKETRGTREKVYSLGKRCMRLNDAIISEIYKGIF